MEEYKMRIHTRFFAVSISNGRFNFRIGSYDHGINGRIAINQSFIALTWGVSRWCLTK